MGTEGSSLAAARRLREMWEHKTEERLGTVWDAAFEGWIEKCGYARVADAVQRVVAKRYIDLRAGRPPTDVGSVLRYAMVLRAEDREPGSLDCYMIRGRMREKFYMEEDENVIATLLYSGRSARAMHRAVDENDTLEGFYADIGVERSPLPRFLENVVPGKVLVRESDPEWPLWVDYYRKTRGQSPPMNKQFGWYFPSRLPPADFSSKRSARRR